MKKFSASMLITKLSDSVWYRSKWLWITLFPLELLYRACVFLRKIRISPSKSFDVPVIVVGNITVGGVGKSPMVMALALFLKEKGYSPGIVSRGYGGQRRSPELPQEITAESTAFLMGDEPIMLANATKVPVVVATDRVAAVRLLMKQHPECHVVISDDGLQHYRLWRDISICLVDGVRCFGNQHCLPAGPLREPLSALAHVDFILETGETSSEENYPGIMKGMLQEDDLICVQVMQQENHQELSFFAGKTVHAVAGIAHPERFFKRLEKAGIHVIPHVFPDHYIFSSDDICFSDDFSVVMTEKDAVKCRAFAKQSVWFLRIRFKLHPVFQEQLMKLLS